MSIGLLLSAGSAQAIPLDRTSSGTPTPSGGALFGPGLLPTAVMCRLHTYTCASTGVWGKLSGRCCWRGEVVSRPASRMLRLRAPHVLIVSLGTHECDSDGFLGVLRVPELRHLALSYLFRRETLTCRALRDLRSTRVQQDRWSAWRHLLVGIAGLYLQCQGMEARCASSSHHPSMHFLRVGPDIGDGDGSAQRATHIPGG